MNKLSIEELKCMRQRANGDNWGEEYISVFDELIAIRELKGDQVPFGYVEHQAAVKVVKGETRFAALTMEPKGDKCLPLFTGPQKPVVPDAQTWDELCRQNPEMTMGDAIIRAAAWNACRDAMLSGAIEAAGGVVKDGE